LIYIGIYRQLSTNECYFVVEKLHVKSVIIALHLHVATKIEDQNALLKYGFET